MGGRRVRSLKMRMEQEFFISRGGQMNQAKQWRYASCRSPKEKTQCW